MEELVKAFLVWYQTPIWGASGPLVLAIIRLVFVGIALLLAGHFPPADRWLLRFFALAQFLGVVAAHNAPALSPFTLSANLALDVFFALRLYRHQWKDREWLGRFEEER